VCRDLSHLSPEAAQLLAEIQDDCRQALKQERALACPYSIEPPGTPCKVCMREEPKP